ncbi:MAG TPA: hypothetical protein VLG38_00575, partial [Gammaproteobacteria bacterium]|nr:hypothetical protein [Gammaproteobacteria bacterium]
MSSAKGGGSGSEKHVNFGSGVHYHNISNPAPSVDRHAIFVDMEVDCTIIAPGKLLNPDSIQAALRREYTTSLKKINLTQDAGQYHCTVVINTTDTDHKKLSAKIRNIIQNAIGGGVVVPRDYNAQARRASTTTTSTTTAAPKPAVTTSTNVKTKTTLAPKYAPTNVGMIPPPPLAPASTIASSSALDFKKSHPSRVRTDRTTEENFKKSHPDKVRTDRPYVYTTKKIGKKFEPADLLEIKNSLHSKYRDATITIRQDLDTNITMTILPKPNEDELLTQAN